MSPGPLKLSVVLSCYNQGHLLPRQLAALGAQDYRPLEIILIDDGSQDDTYNVMCDFARSVPHARVLKNERNMGLIAAVNRAVAETDGDFIYSAAADDEVQPGLFSGLMACAGQYPDAGVIFCDPLWQLRNEVLSQHFNLGGEASYFPPDTAAQLYGSGKILIIPGHTLLWHLPRYKQIGMLRPELGSICDFLPTWSLALRYGIAHVPQPLAMATIHGGQWSRTQTRARAALHRAHRAMLDILLSEEFGDIRDRLIVSRVLGRLPLMLGPLISRGELLSLLTPGDAARLAASRLTEQIKYMVKQMIGWDYQGRKPKIQAG